MVNRNRYRNDYPCQSNSDAGCGNGAQGNRQNGASCEMHTHLSPAQAQLINKLRKIDFALVDTVLYLDAYPHCKKAMEYYKKLLAEQKTLLEKLEKSGMLQRMIWSLQLKSLIVLLRC